MPQIKDYTPAKTTLIDSDEFILQETGGGLTLKTLWSSIKSTLKTYFDTLYDTKGSADAVNTGLYKNAIINGDMNIAQKNGETLTALSSGDYILDIFKTEFSGSTLAISGQQDSTSPPTNSKYSLLLDCTAAEAVIDAGDFLNVKTYIEGSNFTPYLNKTATLSFQVKATKIGIYCVYFKNYAQDRTYVAEYTINVANTWETKTVTLDFNESTGTWKDDHDFGLEIGWCIAGGSTFQTTADAWQTGDYYCTSNQVNGCDFTSNNFRIGQIQLNESSSALPFEHEDIGKTLAKCQRLYEKSYNIGTNVGAATTVGMIAISSTAVNIGDSKSFIKYKRIAPTMTFYDSAGTSSKMDFPIGTPNLSVISNTAFESTIRFIEASAFSRFYHYEANSQF